MFAIAGAIAAMAAASTQTTADLALVPDFSVMSYNVHGLPWPIARGRRAALTAIGQDLAGMRSQGKEPKIVLLQEAFTADAKSIARTAGYPFEARGPSRSDRIMRTGSEWAEPSLGAKKLKGEGDGTLEDSGLLILSDYPIIETSRMPYARYACAGYDCLANKGAVLVRVSVPGAAQPITIIDTHMNSRGASGVRHSRADRAFGWQAKQLRDFVSTSIAQGTPAVVAGDLNIGRVAYRRAMILGGGGLLNGGEDALRTCLSMGLQLPERSDASRIVAKGKDWMFVRGGDVTQLKLNGVTVPFGTEPNGKALSDHFGYVAHYSLFNRGSATQPTPLM
jgi:endonuclease/exonuclease/phosphatase family metal-dependent hydrolase